MDYILQKEKDTTCEFITLINALCHKHDAMTLHFVASMNINYGSETYYQEYKQFRKNPKKFYNKFNMERIEYSGSEKNLKILINENLKKGNLIDFGAHIREPHSFLIADYNEKLDSYMCINARVFTNTQAVEWLPFPLLLKTYKRGIKYNNNSFGKLNVNDLHLSSAAIIFL